MPTTLAEWLEFIERQHSLEIDMGLERCASVWAQLCQVYQLSLDQSVIVTVGGTNGKGTSCAAIQALLEASGLRTGTYASPHISRFNERIKLSGIECSDEAICHAFACINKHRAKLTLTYFEFATLAALFIFAQENVDVLIMEVGLGGRLDATNIVDADFAVLTSIGLDHQDWLGSSLAEISKEKAGIIKPSSQAILGFEPSEVDFDVKSIDAERCHLVTPTIVCNERSMTLQVKHALLPPQLSFLADEYRIDNHQLPLQNAATAIYTASLIAQGFDANHPLIHLLSDQTACAQVLEKVKLAGRFQSLCKLPLVLADVAHNAHAAAYLAKQICKFNHRKIHFVLGMMKDKNIEASLTQLLEFDADWYCCDLPKPRGEGAQRLNDFLTSNGARTHIFESVEKGMAYAFEQYQNTDIIVVFGSFVTVAKASTFVENRKTST